MLILVAGATGNMGKSLIDRLLAQGHRVRALSRNPSKLDASRREKLDDFIQMTSHYDIPALEQACRGVDAVICAYAAVLELQLEGQLLLLRAAERSSSVTKFVAASWNFDWTRMELGEHEIYDPYISFKRQAELSSSLNVCYIFTGIFAEVLFCVPGHADFRPKYNGVWCPENKRMEVWGTGDEIWHWTTVGDAAAFTVAVLEQDRATVGGCWSVCSGTNSLRELASMYSKLRGIEVGVVQIGSETALRRKVESAKDELGVKNWPFYIGYLVQLHTIEGKWALKGLDNDDLGVNPTTFEDFLGLYPDT